MADKEVRQERYDIELPQSIIESFARLKIEYSGDTHYGR